MQALTGGVLPGDTEVPYFDKEVGWRFVPLADLIESLGIEVDDDDGGVTPGLHAVTHQDGGVDEIDVTGLSGLLADEQDPLDHAADHQNGGGDEIDVTGLSGVLADPQTPITENVQDIVGAMVVAGDNTTVTYDDGAGTLTVGETTSFDVNTARIVCDEAYTVVVDEDFYVTLSE